MLAVHPAFPCRLTAGTVLAFDFGLRRIGVAVGELELGLAHPLTTVRYLTAAQRDDRVGGLISQWQPALLIVGLPLHLDGSLHELSSRVHNFASRLRARFGLPVILFDERLTSAAAATDLREAGVRRPKPHLDSQAAREILQSFLNARKRD